VARMKYESCNNLVATVVGSLLLGIGMAVGGACPGMVLIQTGAGVKSSLYTVAGGMMGAFVFGISEPLIRPWISAAHIPSANVFIDQRKNDQSYPYFAFVLGCVLHGMAFVAELCIPWKNELSSQNSYNCNIWTCRHWPPHLAGVVIGLLQIPCLIVFGNPLGGSSSYVCITGQCMRILPLSLQDKFPTIKTQYHRWWQVCYVTTAIIGSWLAVAVSEGNVNTLEIVGTSKPKAFVGGFLMLYGSRMAKGCTSGHGISGFGLLSTSSLISVLSMFGGGIAFSLAVL